MCLGKTKHLEPKWHHDTCTHERHDHTIQETSSLPPNQCSHLTGCVITCGDIHTNSACSAFKPAHPPWAPEPGGTVEAFTSGQMEYALSLPRNLYQFYAC